MTSGAQQKLVMIGIDAGDRLFIEAHAARLPNLRRLLDRSPVRRLDTSSKWFTGSVWPTFYTGTSPGEHGIYHHLQWDPQAMRVRRVAPDWLYCEPFWYRLARAGRKVCVLDVPMSFPSRLAEGVEVVNWGSHDQLGRFTTNRPSLTRDIRRRFGAHPMGIEVPVDKTRGELQSIRDRLVAGAARKGELAAWLLRTQEWNFFLTVFGECHRGGHILWPEDDPDSAVPRDALLDVYAAVDAAVGALVAAIPDVPVVLFALHGMQEYGSQEHLVAPAMERINAVARGVVLDENSHDSVPQTAGLMRRLRRSLPAGLQNAVAKAVPVGVRDWVEARATSGGLDWAKTPGFALLADLNGYVRLNLVGRESAGSLARDSPEYASYVELLRTSLAELRADGDESTALVAEVMASEEIYPGQRNAYLPDWVITWRPQAPVAHARSKRLGRIAMRLNKGRSGNHRPEGFVSLPGTWHGEASRLHSITDLAPFVLHRFGLAAA